MKTPLIIQYTNLLHKHRNPNSEALKGFLAKHSGDKDFLRRAKILNKVFILKEELVTT